jgi:hypothetical protein
MTEPTEKNELIIYENVDTAPIISFDMAPAHGRFDPPRKARSLASSPF